MDGLKRNRLRFSGWWAILGTMLACGVIYMSLAPLSLSGNIYFFQSDKVVHFAAYAAMMFWFSQIYPKRPSSLLIASGLIMLGVLLEFIQDATGYRTFEYLDMTANALGVIFGYYLAQTRFGGLFSAIERYLSCTKGRQTYSADADIDRAGGRLQTKEGYDYCSGCNYPKRGEDPHR